VAAVALSLVGASASTLQAQADVGAPSITRLGDLYARVLRENAKVAAADALARAARLRIPGASRPPDPQLQLGFMNYTLPGLAPMATLGMTQFQLMQMVPLGGKLRLAGRVAGAQATATDERARNVSFELRSQAAMSFYDLYATDQQLVATRESLRLLQDVARTTESMYRVGQGRQADVLRAQVEIARMIQDTVRMQAMRASMLARLGALASGSDSALRVVPALPRFPNEVPTEAWLDSVAFAERPMLRAAIEELRAADATATLARRELIPDLQVGVQYGQRGATMYTTDPAGAPMSERTTERMGSVMIGASIPIFARSRQLAMRGEANAMKAMAEADVAAMRADTRGKIGEARASLAQARQLAAFYRSTILPQARATVASASSAYRAGQVDFMTLLDGEMTVNKYRRELFTLEADEGKAWAELEMLTGRTLLDANSVAPVAPRIAAGGATARTIGGAP
jgi:outer membrane protein, heavy metal efflux system